MGGLYCALWVVSIALIDSYAEHRRGVLGEDPAVKGGVKGNHQGGAREPVRRQTGVVFVAEGQDAFAGALAIEP
jgi:hypothetical protein